MPLDRPLRAGTTLALLAAAVCLGPRLVQAASPGYQFELGVAASDNIQRSSLGGSTDAIGIEEVEFNWHDKRPWLSSDIDADLTHESYFQHTYGAEIIGNFIGQERINLAETLVWDLTENFGQGRLDPLAPITPDNRENINYFSTGPTMALPLGGQTQLNASAQYGRVDYQRTPLNNSRITEFLGLQHDFSPSTKFSINTTNERINFVNDQLNSDYDRQEAFARFDTRGSRTDIGIDLGYGQLTVPKSRSVVARLELTRRLSANSTIAMAVGHDYSDGAASFLIAQALTGAGLTTQSTPQDGAPFLDNFAMLAWNFRLARTTLDFNGRYARDRYPEAAGLNNELTVINARATRRITPVLELGLTEYVVRQQFDSTGDSATEVDSGLLLTWRVGRSLSVFFAYYLDKGSSNLPTDQFTENRLWLAIGYGRAAEVPPGPAPLKLPVRQ